MDRSNKELTWSKGSFPAWGKMLLSIGVVLLLMLVLFQVKYIEITGNVHYSQEEIIEASGVAEGDALMGVNKTKMASRLLVSLPYIEQVVITKMLPGTIVLEVKECTAAYVAQSEFQTYWVMNSRGKLLEEVKEPSGYPMVQGAFLSLPTAGDIAEFTDPEKGALVAEIYDAAEATGYTGDITAINVEDKSNVVVTYRDDIDIQMGDGSRAEYRFLYFQSALTAIPSGSRGVLDLTFSKGEQAIFHPFT